MGCKRATDGCWSTGVCGRAAWSGQASFRTPGQSSEGRLALLVQLGSGPEAGGEEATYLATVGGTGPSRLRPSKNHVSAPQHHVCLCGRLQASALISSRVCQASVWTLHSVSSFNTTRPLTRASMNHHEPSHVASCVPVSAQHRGTGTPSPSPSCVIPSLPILRTAWSRPFPTPCHARQAKH